MAVLGATIIPTPGFHPSGFFWRLSASRAGRTASSPNRSRTSAAAVANAVRSDPSRANWWFAVVVGDPRKSDQGSDEGHRTRIVSNPVHAADDGLVLEGQLSLQRVERLRVLTAYSHDLFRVNNTIEVSHHPQFHIKLPEPGHFTLKIVKRLGKRHQLLLLLAGFEAKPVQFGHHLLDTVVISYKVPQTKNDYSKDHKESPDHGPGNPVFPYPRGLIGQDHYGIFLFIHCANSPLGSRSAAVIIYKILTPSRTRGNWRCRSSPTPASEAMSSKRFPLTVPFLKGRTVSPF